MEPNNDRVSLDSDLSVCHACGEPSTRWMQVLARTVGVCRAHAPRPNVAAVNTILADLDGERDGYQEARATLARAFDDARKKTTMTTIAAGLPITSDALVKPPMIIPGDDGRPYKTELVVSRSPERTIKINWWHGPDDAGDRARPHSHPWDFTSTVMHGAITHTRFRFLPAIYDAGMGDYGSGPEYSGGMIVQSASVERITETIRAGESYAVAAHEYHLVTAVEPGTVTRMECGPLVAGGAWGYLDAATGEHVPAPADPAFRERLAAVNPWMAQ